MLDINFIRENPEEVKRGVAKKMVDPKMVDKFLKLDADWRQKTAMLDELKAEQNKISADLAAQKTEHLLSRAQILKKRIGEIQKEQDELGEKRKEILENLPNLPFPDVPVGENEAANRFLREIGQKPTFKFKPKNYLELAEKLGLIDIKKASAVAGTRFSYLIGEAVLLEFALVKLAFDTLLKDGFLPVVPPVMARPEIMKKMGKQKFLKDKDAFYIEEDDLYLVGSSEHTIGPLLLAETLKEEDLPRRYLGFSTCFRREAGSYGKDTKGIFRVHQFDKVEMFSFTKPADSGKELEFLLSLQEQLMQKLELPYRVVEISTGDMGWADARQYDIEAWFPGSEGYRETHSASDTTDFQARGINAKYQVKNPALPAGRQKSKVKSEYVHMLNATAFAIGRTLIAIFENYQTKAGTVKVPKILQDYLGKKEIGGK